ncbi:hypothetical protein EC957_001744 [Mortierella hygrophila]|uniref:Uncharacterized protein n=1 Tax=Mortierella hygrophila TaxID=979708 RepID=A0A9P6F4G5_9FUNG|nr:hypothetical protein EC957_001744 [Mortierella hygrophila]
MWTPNCKNPKTMISPRCLLYSIVNTIQGVAQRYLADGYFQEVYVPQTNITVDETIIHFVGISKHRYHIKDKPMPVGNKVLALRAAAGLLRHARPLDQAQQCFYLSCESTGAFTTMHDATAVANIFYSLSAKANTDTIHKAFAEYQVGRTVPVTESYNTSKSLFKILERGIVGMIALFLFKILLFGC